MGEVPETASGGGKAKKRRRPGLYVQVLLAIVCGILLGRLFPQWGVAMRPLGEGFVKLINVLIGPIRFCTVVVGIAGIGSLRKVGRVGLKAVACFEVMTTAALVLGIMAVHLVRPGASLHADPAQLDASTLEHALAAAPAHGVAAHLLATIPDSFVGAFTNAEVLQVLVLATLTGIAVAGLGQRGKPIVGALEHATSALFAMVSLVMKLAPLGAFGAMAFTIGRFGLGTLGNLAKLIGTFYVAAILFVFVVLGVMTRALGLSLVKLIRYLREELVIVLGTSSSESALPRLMVKLERLGCKREIVRLVVPTGYSFNLAGTCIYLAMGAVFVAQALDVPMSPADEIALLGVLLLTSKGAASVAGSGFITLAATLAAMETVPVAGLVLLLGIDRFMSETRALTNFVGNAVATLIVARWEGALDLERAKATLGKGVPLDPGSGVTLG